MKLKTVTIEGKVYAEVNEGKPVYVHDDGKEIGFDAPASIDKIRTLNAEAKTHREAKEEAESKLKNFEGIEDVDAAKAALETVANLKSGELTSAAKVQEIKDAAKKAADEQVAEVRRGLEAQIAELTKTSNELRSGWNGEKIGTAFSNSKYVSEKLAVPGAVAQKIFADNFRVEDGNLVAYLGDNKVYSRENPGELAGFDEALGLLVDKYQHRDSIVRGSGGGSGGRPNGGGGGGGDKQLTRQEFEGLQPAERSARIKDGYTVVDAN